MVNRTPGLVCEKQPLITAVWMTIIVSLGCSAGLQAAIAPAVKNQHDLNIMIAFIGQHQRVADTLVSIDFESKVVNYDDKCQAVFHYPNRLGFIPGSN